MEREVSPAMVAVVLVIAVLILILAWYLIYGGGDRLLDNPNICIRCKGVGQEYFTPLGGDFKEARMCPSCGGDGRR